MPWWNPFGKRTDLEEQTAREQRAVNATARQFNGFGNAFFKVIKYREEKAKRDEEAREAAIRAEFEERRARQNAYLESEEEQKERANRIANINAKEKLDENRMKLDRIFNPLVDSSSRDSETGQLTDTAMIEFKALMNLWKEAEDMYAANIPIDYDELRRKADAVAPAAAGTLRASYENAIRGGRRKTLRRKRKVGKSRHRITRNKKPRKSRR
jgi:hypothetical protein